MSEFDHDPSANTGRFRAFAERSDEDIRRRSRRTSPALLVVVGVIVLAVVIVVVAMA
jgi:hypothetical protein